MTNTLTPEQIQKYRRRYGLDSTQESSQSESAKARIQKLRQDAGYDISDEYSIGVAENNKNKSKSLLTKAADLSDATVGKAADFFFGNTGKVVGGIITRGIGGAKSIAGGLTGNQQLVEEGRKLQETKSTGVENSLAMVELYPGGGFIVNALKRVPGGKQAIPGLATAVSKVPEGARAYAVEQFAKALGATKEAFKVQTKKVVPEMVERGVSARSLNSLQKKASEMASATGSKIDEFIEALPETAKVKVEPIISALQKEKSKYIVDNVVVEPAAVDALEAMQQTITQFGDDVSTRSLIAVRRIWDETVAKAGGFVKDDLSQLRVSAKREATNAIRKELAEEYPELNKINKEFTFWNTIDDIVSETIKRQSTQAGGLTPKIMGAAGVAGGFAQSGIGIAVLAGASLNLLAKLIKSPGWKMIKAKKVDQLAQVLAEGNQEKVIQLINRLLVGWENSTDE